ncbi:unnamed protein product [Mesocestoides corti]|uniref:Gfo/Idh/MocA-like oxidoreductase N-terminal domain-containing protein n=1 Tax=Mesocestoides corti TaxID=53468 RepID=A0A0R3UM22_MESCO|nr:unnamed protein product [Mesocestoides corti]
MLGIALFGLGRAGRIHARNILAHPQCRLLYAIDPSQQAVSTFNEVIPTAANNIHVIVSCDAADLDCVFNDTSVEAVFVCSTTGSHYEIARRAILCGKAVFCEKPISVDVEETEALYRMALAKNIPLHCSFNRQVCEMYDHLQSGNLGSIHVVKTCSRDHPCPSTKFLRESGGFFHDCATHDLDMICWLVGAMPQRVFVTATTQDESIRELNDVDTAVIVLNFPSRTPSEPGPIAIVDISRHGCYGYDQRVEILTDGGMLRSENQQASGIVLSIPGATQSAPIKDSFPQRYDESYVQSLNVFVKCVLEKRPAEISGHDVINISRLAHACDESLKSGQPVDFQSIKLDF